MHTSAACVALLGFSAGDSKVESGREGAPDSKADAMENKADTVRKDSKTVAADVARSSSPSRTGCAINPDSGKS